MGAELKGIRDSMVMARVLVFGAFAISIFILTLKYMPGLSNNDTSIILWIGILLIALFWAYKFLEDMLSDSGR